MINCYGCSKPIDDMYYLLAGDQFYWHFNCLKCSSCLCCLKDQSKCFINDGKIYCMDHYYSNKLNKSFNNKENINEITNCKHCKKVINLDDYVIRLKTPSISLYHMHCFLCNECNKNIMPGEPYGIIQNELVYCNQHYFNQLTKQIQTEVVLQNTANYNENNLLKYSSIDLNNNNSHSITGINTNSSKKKSFKRSKSGDDDEIEFNINSSNSSNNKRKRYRTSFKHQQLGVLKAYFQMNPNPDSKDLSVLSKRTGLQNRVLQVWFQNARAKQRKSTNTNSTDKPTLARNFYSSIIETEFNKSVLEEEDDDDDDDNEEEENEEEIDQNNDSNQNDIFSNNFVFNN